MLLIGLLAFLLMAVALLSFIRPKWARWAAAVVLDVFFCAQLSSVYIGRSFIDYKYYQHLNVETLAMASAFKVEAGLMVLLAVGLPFALAWAGWRLDARLYPLGRGRAAAIKGTVLAASMAVLVLPSESMGKKLSEILAIVSADTRTESGLAHSFTPKEQLQVTDCPGKNIVIISLESFEKAFVHPANRTLTPLLQERMKHWHWYDMTPTNGTSFTVASLYTVLTGLPSYFAGNGNSYFKGTTSSKLTNLATILAQCGYGTYHLSNNADFAGTRELLNALGISNIIGGGYRTVGQPLRGMPHERLV